MGPGGRLETTAIPCPWRGPSDPGKVEVGVGILDRQLQVTKVKPSVSHFETNEGLERIYSTLGFKLMHCK